MGNLQGLQEYLDSGYENSVFDQAFEEKKAWEFHLHGPRVVRARVAENLTYDLKLDIEGQDVEEVPKIQVKFLHQTEHSEAVQKLVKFDKKVQKLGLEPIPSPADRDFVKNKSLFPLMQQREVVSFTLLEGETIRGLIAAFTRYEITVNMKGGVPVTLLRHSIYDLRNKKNRCFMKSVQQKAKDWEKSELFVP